MSGANECLCDESFVSHNKTWELADMWRKPESQNDSFLETHTVEPARKAQFVRARACVCVWVRTCDRYVCASLLAKTCRKHRLLECVFVCVVPVQMPPPYYSWLVDGCWLSHLPDFVPARCGRVTGKAPKHSSISTIVQRSFGSRNSVQYPFSRSRCSRKCLHTQKRGGQTYWPAPWTRAAGKTKGRHRIRDNLREIKATDESLTLHLLGEVVIVIKAGSKRNWIWCVPKMLLLLSSVMPWASASRLPATWGLFI